MKKYRLHLLVALFAVAISFSGCAPHGGPQGGGGHHGEHGHHR
jgi:hypothetical protein